MLWDGWSGPDLVAALLGVAGIVGGLFGWASGRKGQDAAQKASVEAASAQREAAEALARHASAAERLLALEESRSKAAPVRFTLRADGDGGVITNAGDQIAKNLTIDVESDSGQVLDVARPFATDIYPDESVPFRRWRGGAHAQSRLRLSWVNEDGSTGEQTLVI